MTTTTGGIEGRHDRYESQWPDPHCQHVGEVGQDGPAGGETQQQVLPCHPERDPPRSDQDARGGSGGEPEGDQRPHAGIARDLRQPDEHQREAQAGSETVYRLPRAVFTDPGRNGEPHRRAGEGNPYPRQQGIVFSGQQPERERDQ